MLEIGWKIDSDILIIHVNVHDPATGGESDADALPEVRIYENQVDDPIDTDIMQKQDDPNTVGFYSIAIPLFSLTGFVYDKTFAVRIRAVVNGVAGVKVFSFHLKQALENIVEGTLTEQDVMRIMLSAVALKLEDAATLNPKFKSLDGTKTRILGTVDGNGNRTEIILDPSD